jgi:hypothetical protein
MMHTVQLPYLILVVENVDDELRWDPRAFGCFDENLVPSCGTLSNRVRPSPSPSAFDNGAYLDVFIFILDVTK